MAACIDTREGSKLTLQGKRISGGCCISCEKAFKSRRQGTDLVVELEMNAYDTWSLVIQCKQSFWEVSEHRSFPPKILNKLGDVVV